MSAMTSEKTAPWIPADTFGMRLRRIRAALEMNGQDFAAKCGLDRGQLSAWENGTMPRNLPKVAQAVADATGVDRAWLAFGEGTVTHERRTFADVCSGQLSLDDVVIDLRDGRACTYIAAAA